MGLTRTIHLRSICHLGPPQILLVFALPHAPSFSLTHRSIPGLLQLIDAIYALFQGANKALFHFGEIKAINIGLLVEIKFLEHLLNPLVPRHVAMAPVPVEILLHEPPLQGVLGAGALVVTPRQLFVEVKHPLQAICLLKVLFPENL